MKTLNANAPISRSRIAYWLATAILFLTASVSRWVASAIGLQIVTPAMFIYIALVGWLLRPALAGTSPAGAWSAGLIRGGVTPER